MFIDKTICKALFSPNEDLRRLKLSVACLFIGIGVMGWGEGRDFRDLGLEGAGIFPTT